MKRLELQAYWQQQLDAKDVQAWLKDHKESVDVFFRLMPIETRD